MAISSEALRQRLLANLVNRPTPNTVGGAFGDLGGSIATALQLRRDVPNLQATETADKIGEEVRLRDALAASGIEPGAAGSIASAPAALRGALLGLQETPADRRKATIAAEDRTFDRENTLFQQGATTERLANERRRVSLAETEASKPESEPLVQVFDPATGITTFQPRSEAVGRQPPPKSGLEVTTDPDTGQTTVRTNVQGGQQFGKKATGQIESQLVELSTARERLGAIAAEFNPDFLTLQTRAGMSLKEMRDKVGLLPPDQQAQLADFTRFRQNTIKNLNRTIKEITGAAMNQQEVPRIQGEVPVASDSPAVFETKLRNAMRLAGLAQARLVHLRNQGVQPGKDFGGIGLDDMPSIMDSRGEQLEQELIEQGFAPEIAEEQALAQVGQEFGF